MKHFKLISLVLLLFLARNVCAKAVDGQACAASCLCTDNIKLVQASRTIQVFRVVDGEGYAIVSLLNPNVPKIIGYSHTSVWKPEEMPACLSEWLGYLQADSVCNGRTVTRRAVVSSAARQSVLPLVKSSWHQDSPYNDLSPVISDGNVKTAAGCVAIAAAQIVNYWKSDNPSSTLQDTPVYPYGAAPVTYSISHGSPNRWDEIRDTYTDVGDEAARNAVAQLVYVVGTTSYLNYASSTGGQISDAANAIYSQYRLLSDYATKKKFSQEEWENLIYGDLSKGFPILYSGSTAYGAGHAFVVDGYDGDRNLYHINFGWGGSGDGYYSLDETEGLGGYCVNQSCVYGIRPEKRNVTLTCDMENTADGASCVFNLNIVNQSTLSLGNIVLVDGSSTVQTELLTVEANIPNDCVERQVKITLPSNTLKGIKSVVFKDDWGTNLGTFDVGAAGINHMQAQPQNTHTRIYDLMGKPVLHPNRGDIYLRPQGTGYRKVLAN